MSTEPERPSESTALADALNVIGDRWTLLVIAALLDGPARFGELQEAVGGIAPNVLTQRLRHLTSHGVVLARPYSERPVRHVYELSDSGRGLAGPLALLAGWGAAHLPGADPPRHAPCGTPLEVRWWCPVCEIALPPGEEHGDEDLHFA